LGGGRGGEKGYFLDKYNIDESTVSIFVQEIWQAMQETGRFILYLGDPQELPYIVKRRCTRAESISIMQQLGIKLSVRTYSKQLKMQVVETVSLHWKCKAHQHLSVCLLGHQKLKLTSLPW